MRLLTLVFGVVVAQFGEQGVAATHAALGLAACAAWLFSSAAMAWVQAQRPRGVRRRKLLRSRVAKAPD